MTILREPYYILVDWITERENIRVKKEVLNESPPWTDDPLLAKWRWCNVNRCHDRETRWIFKNIVGAHAKSDSLWFNLAIARFINWSPTLHKLGYFETWNPDRFCEVISLLMRVGSKVYTGAYMIRAGTGEDAKKPKERYLCDRIFNPLWARRAEVKELVTCEDWDKFFGSIFGMGPFMRNQIITDLKYTKYLAPYSTKCGTDFCSDWRTFCLAGPGTTRGLNRIHGFDLTHQWNQDRANLLMRNLRSRLENDLAPHVSEYLNDLNNVANCLCEFDKYMRLRNGEGEPRSTYRPSPDPLP